MKPVYKIDNCIKCIPTGNNYSYNVNTSFSEDEPNGAPTSNGKEMSGFGVPSEHAVLEIRCSRGHKELRRVRELGKQRMTWQSEF